METVPTKLRYVADYSSPPDFSKFIAVEDSSIMDDILNRLTAYCDFERCDSCKESIIFDIHCTQLALDMFLGGFVIYMAKDDDGAFFAYEKVSA